MKYFAGIIVCAVLLAACSKEGKQETPAQSAPAGGTSSESQPKRDITTGALEKIDPDVKKYDAAVTMALKAYQGSSSAAAKEALVKAYLAFGDYLTYESPLSPRQGKYHRALVEYRKALSLDAANEKAKNEIAQIEDIYRSMNRPIPGDE